MTFSWCNPPNNLDHNLDAANRSDNDFNPAPDALSVNVDDNDEMDDDEANLEAAEESAETEMGKKFVSCIWLN